jgi:ribonuclease P protein component
MMMSQDQRFRPHERLRDPEAFRRAFERKRSVSNELLIMYGSENGLAYSRIGISIGRKKVKSAVARNRVKRLLREVFRQTRNEWPTGIDYVVVPRGPSISFDQLASSLPGLAKAIERRLSPPTSEKKGRTQE